MLVQKEKAAASFEAAAFRVSVRGAANGGDL